jgi:hypothetical protein
MIRKKQKNFIEISFTLATEFAVVDEIGSDTVDIVVKAK